MFEYLTTQAARTEHTQVLAHMDEIGAHLPQRASRWARMVARIRATTPVTPGAPVVSLPARPATTGSSSVAA